MYKPKFIMTDRNKKKALWVTMPDNISYNIGDIQGSIVEKVQNAIIHAFELGYRAHGMIDTSMTMPYDIGFKEEK